MVTGGWGARGRFDDEPRVSGQREPAKVGRFCPRRESFRTEVRRRTTVLAKRARRAVPSASLPNGDPGGPGCGRGPGGEDC